MIFCKPYAEATAADFRSLFADRFDADASILDEVLANPARADRPEPGLIAYGERGEVVGVMVHGVVRAEGGWRPFEDAAAFRRFLEAIRAEESAGRVRVVDYAEGHLRPPRSAVREFAFKFYRRLCGAEVPEI